MRTNGSEEVSRRETKRVFLARAGRRSKDSRGPEVVTKDDGLPPHRGVFPARETEGREARRVGRGSCERGAPERGGSSRAEPRGLGGPWRQSALSPERVAPG